MFKTHNLLIYIVATDLENIFLTLSGTQKQTLFSFKYENSRGKPELQIPVYVLPWV